MAGTLTVRRPAHRLVVAIALALIAALGSMLVAPPAPAAALGRWTGGVSLYRSGSFTTQRTWLWCTAADIQIIRNMVRGTRDHTTVGQRRYFDWMRDHNRYRLPLSAGVDAQGWAAGMRQFVDSRYRLVASHSFDSALRSAVTRMRLTNLPVGVTVSHGNHAWILSGFTATADPARTTRFTVTSVRVVGPLYGLQSRNGYDMRPNTRLTVAQFKRFFTPWRYAPRRMVWDGTYVSIQPVPTSMKASKPALPPARPTAASTPAPKAAAPPTWPPSSIPMADARRIALMLVPIR